MAGRNPFEAAALRSADRAVQMAEEAEKSNAVPFGMQRVDIATWRRRFEGSQPAMKAQMLESLGETRQERLAAYFTRIAPRRKPVFGE